MSTIKCPRCEEKKQYSPEEIHWDYNGLGYDTKYVVCPNCGRIIILKYEEYDIDINNDERMFL